MRFLLFILLLAALPAGARDTTKLYNPRANAAADVARLTAQAQKEGKRILIQVGGNWCLMCYRLNAFIQTDSTLKDLVDDNYLTYHLNYSPENKNAAYLSKLGNPQRFGFPVLVILEKDGSPLHTQNMALLLKGNGYDYDKLKSFLVQWRPAATAQTNVL